MTRWPRWPCWASRRTTWPPGQDCSVSTRSTPRSRTGEECHRGPWETAPIAPVAEALRDDAIATGDYAPALKQLEARYSMMASGTGPRVWSRGLGLVYAHTLVLAGETQRGRKLATSILVQLDAESVGRTENWFCRERAAAFAILGDDERALAELAITQKMKKFYSLVVPRRARSALRASQERSAVPGAGGTSKKASRRAACVGRADAAQRRSAEARFSLDMLPILASISLRQALTT